MKIALSVAAALAASLVANADTIPVASIKCAGPFGVVKPLMIDSVDVNNAKFREASVLDTPVSDLMFANAKTTSTLNLEKANSIYVAKFDFNTSAYTSATVKVDGVKDVAVWIDGKRGETLSVDPGSHSVVIKCLATEAAKDVKVSVIADGKKLAVGENGGRSISLADILDGRRYSTVGVSPNGKYMSVSYSTTYPGGSTAFNSEVREIATGKVVGTHHGYVTWMPKSNLYYYDKAVKSGRDVIAVNPENGSEKVIAKGLECDQYAFAPSEDYLIVSKSVDCSGTMSGVYDIQHLDERVPGWKKRSNIYKYDLATGVMQQLTYGYHNAWSCGVTADGKKMLVMTSTSELGPRPTVKNSLLLVDLATMDAQKLVDNDGFVGEALLSPDGTKVLVKGSPEAFGGIGSNVAEGQTPSMVDNQLFMLDVASKEVTPLTKYFNPSVEAIHWNRGDGMVYFTAENRDCLTLYRMNPRDGKIQQIDVPEDMVNRFAVSAASPVMMLYGQGASNSDRLYSVNTKNLKVKLVEDLGAEKMKGIELGKCEAWDFVNQRGDTICGRFYLPPHFDANKKYPMIVNYYGGCSPISRTFESRYPHHVYAAMGYVVYVLEPSGATGFGQEFSARHVNTAGQGPADDVIEGVQKFLAEHKYVDATKVGCIGASYGGFMTQYLQTKTDMFAAAISHAGISDHTSYWGEGWWGYSYSEVSMANSYPWKDTDLFVKQSPLYNADKIHTPLLFIHGSTDMNVPFGESVQMFNALKLLNRETAFVVVEGEGHHVTEYGKRVKWQNTIFAWFAKWLQGDDSWWNALYPERKL